MQQGLLNTQNAEVQEIEASPEEQALFEQYQQAALSQVLGNPQAFQGLMKSLEASRNNPIDGVARIALAMYEQAEKKLGPLDDEDISEGVGEAIIEAILDFAEQAGIIQADPELAQAIYLKMAQMWIEANPDRADPEDLAYIQSQKGGAA